MIGGFDQGATLHRPRPPSVTAYVAIVIAIVAAIVACAHWLSIERGRAADARTDAFATTERRALLADAISTLSCVEIAELHYRQSGTPEALARYRSLRAIAGRQLDRLADADRAHPAVALDVRRLRALARTRFAASDALARADATAAPGEAARALAMSQAIDAVAARLSRGQERRLDRDKASAEAASALLGRMLTVMIVAAILAVATAIWLAWRSRCRHHLLELRAFDSMARLRAVFSGTSDAIVILDAAGRIEEVNAAAGRLLGYVPRELEGTYVDKIVDMVDGDLSLAQCVGLGAERSAMPLRVDRVARGRDGTPIPVDVALGMMPSAAGVRIVASLRDVSERKAAERTKDDFISTISHELRTPLTSVVGALGLLREGAAGALPDAAARLTDIAENNARRLIRLVNDILDIDRLSSGRVSLATGPLDLREIASRARDDAEGIAAPRAVKLALDVPDMSADVVGDAERLLQVIGNLLSNAIRFSPAGGTVTLTVERRGGDALVRVDDQGPGVPPGFRNRLFGRFNQSSAGAAIPGGTGLGLAISREIVRAHHGDIWYADGGGARFCFSLPLIATGPVDNRRRLLLCEDDIQIAALLREMIEDEGYLVDRCGSVTEACRMARTGRYDALLLDLTLPDAEDLDAVRAIRDQPETIMLPIIVISGVASRRSIDPEATELGVLDWIDKPVNHGRLLRALDAAIHEADSNRPVLLHVEDDPDVRQVVALALADRGRILQAGSLASARAALAACAPAAAILDLDLPDGSGLDLLPLLADGPHGRIPTVIYTAGLDLPPVGGPIDVVLVKSMRSPLVLSETIGAVLARQPVLAENRP